jgi:nicotinamide riboside transporter PnuC
MGKPESADNTKLVNNKLCFAGFILGLASILLSEIGIIPLAAIVCSIIGLVKFDKAVNKNKWQGVLGLILGILYLLVNAHLHGHF